ncbi:MAG TPA: DUF420 domain-containing protein [Anaerolineales bacterium]|nr:DUF420 domain-containing protein [Anaerolineales bacterium]
MTEILHRPGFLGTSANFAADMTLTISLAVALLFTIGFLLARARHYTAHRWVQTSAAALNAILVGWMMILPFRDFVLPGIPGRLDERFYAITTIHGLVGGAALIFGVFVALRGNELVPASLKFRDYKRFMRVAYGLYMLATLIGVLVYLTWFVGNPNPPVYQ